jgi:hypothetical protein
MSIFRNALAKYRLANLRRKELKELCAQVGIDFMSLNTKLHENILKRAIEQDARKAATELIFIRYQAKTGKTDFPFPPASAGRMTIESPLSQLGPDETQLLHDMERLSMARPATIPATGSNAYKKFAWLLMDHDELVQKCKAIIQYQHNHNKSLSLPKMLWEHQDAMAFIAVHEDLRDILASCSTLPWRIRKDDYKRIRLLAIVMAFEVLGENFAGWAEQYPASAKRAKEVLNQYFSDSKTRLLDLYFANRHSLDKRKLVEIYGPQSIDPRIN